MSKLSEIHNASSAEALKMIVEPTLAAGGKAPDVLMVLESVMMGVIMFTAKPGGRNLVLDKVVEIVKERIRMEELDHPRRMMQQ